MNNTFQILAGFLEKYAEDVEGRSDGEVPAEARERLRRFARGETPEADRIELLNALRTNPQWVAVLAEEVKTLRAR